MAVYENTYAITISPPMRYAKCTWLIDNDYPYINEHLGRMCFSYRLYPEFKDGRLHYHGVVYNLDMIKMNAYKYKLDRLGFTLFKKIKDEDNFIKWLCYCLEDWEMTEQVFNKYCFKVEPLDKFYKEKLRSNRLDKLPKSLTFESYGFAMKGA